MVIIFLSKLSGLKAIVIYVLQWQVKVVDRIGTVTCQTVGASVAGAIVTIRAKLFGVPRATVMAEYPKLDFISEE